MGKKQDIEQINLEKQSDNWLIKVVSQQNWHSGAQLEMIRRLKDSTENLNKSIKKFDRSSGWFALALIFLTSIMLIGLGFQILLAYYK